MKKILYLAIVALGLQSCLKDKEHESDIFNGVDKDKKVISIADPYKITVANVIDTKVAALPTIGLSLKGIPQEFEIPIELRTGKLTTDINVTISQDAALIVSYNAKQQAVYDAALIAYNAAVLANTLPLPPVPVVPVPYISLPEGKYTVGNVVIKAGTSIGIAILTIPNALADLTPTGKYLLPITLSSGDGVLIANPTSLITIKGKVFSPFAGKFRYSGFRVAEGSAGVFTTVNFPATTASDYVWNVPTAGPDLGCTNCTEAPTGIFPAATYVKFTFTGVGGTTLTVSQAFAGNLGSSTATPPLSSPPVLAPGNVPVVEYNAAGEVSAIRGLKWGYVNGTPAIRKFEVDMIRQP